MPIDSSASCIVGEGGATMMAVSGEEGGTAAAYFSCQGFPLMVP